MLCEKALCKHIDPSAFWATLIFYRVVRPSCNSSWCLQYRGLWFSGIIGCPCFHPFAYPVMQRTPLTYPLCPFLPTCVCAQSAPLIHPMVFISVAACRSSFLFKAWLFPLCFFPLLGSIGSSWCSLWKPQTLYTQMTCVHTPIVVLYCVFERRGSAVLRDIVFWNSRKGIGSA